MPECEQYFSKAKCRWVEAPSIKPNPEIISKMQDSDGVIHGGKKDDMPKPKPKKKYLPGERLLRKLTNTKGKDRTMDRIQKSISKNVDFLIQ